MRRRYFPKIEMSFWFFLGLSLFLLFDQGNLGSMCVAAVLLHELGHIAAMTLLGVKIQSTVNRRKMKLSHSCKQSCQTKVCERTR